MFFLNEALSLAEKGFSIIPIGKDKKPLLSSWKEFQNRRATAEEITGWFDRYGEKTQIGIVTGKISGLLVVDIDKDKVTGNFHPKGQEIFEKFKEKTLVAQTGSGGYHLYFLHPEDFLKNSSLEQFHIDTRGEGGYVVAPPSSNMRGQYKWLNEGQPLADFPVELKELLYNPKQPLLERQLPEATNIMLGVDEGSRNNSAAKLCGKLLSVLPEPSWGLGFQLLEVWNRQCNPPLDLDELRSVFNSISSAEKAKRVENTRKIEFITLGQLYQKDCPPLEWLVESLIPKGGLIALSGPPSSGKTWLALEIAKSVTCGLDFVDNFSTRQAPVVIVDEESTLPRLKDRAKKISIPEGAPISITSRCGFELTSSSNFDSLLTEIEKRQAKLVIFDSLIRIHQAKENDANEMAKVMAILKKITDLRVAVIFIHHSRKDSFFANNSNGQSMRGSSDILAGVDVHLTLVGDKVKKEIKVTQTKSRDSEELKAFLIKQTEEGGKITFTYAGEAKEKKPKSEVIRSKIIEFLGQSQEGVPKGEVYSALIKYGGERKISSILSQLVVDKVVLINKVEGNKQVCTLAEGVIGEDEEGDSE